LRVTSRGLGDVYKRQELTLIFSYQIVELGLERNHLKFKHITPIFTSNIVDHSSAEI
jgi:hypothetical protein